MKNAQIKEPECVLSIDPKPKKPLVRLQSE